MCGLDKLRFSQGGVLTAWTCVKASLIVRHMKLGIELCSAGQSA